MIDYQMHLKTLLAAAYRAGISDSESATIDDAQVWAQEQLDDKFAVVDVVAALRPINALLAAVRDVVDNADDTGCDGDLTVTSRAAVEALEGGAS